jgi:lipid A disaccharide synthetase
MDRHAFYLLCERALLPLGGDRHGRPILLPPGQHRPTDTHYLVRQRDHRDVLVSSHLELIKSGTVTALAVHVQAG